MIRRPPRSTPLYSSAASDVYKRQAFTRDPKLVWSWYQWRRQMVADKVPNPALHALAQWQYHAQTSDQTVTLITQNVDDLHEQAGSAVTHLHGHLWRDRCGQCEIPYPQQSRAAYIKQDTIRFDDKLITCPHCDGYIRPDIVWFGEALPCLLYTSPSPRDRQKSRMPSSA